MRKGFDLKHSRISMLEVEAVPRVVFLSPDWLQYCFMYKKLIARREFWLALEQTVHFGEGGS
jgi:hypothetical protein